jgi:hypothetical protein
LHWPRLALSAVRALAALLNFWQLDRLEYANTYYAAAVKSMLQGWHNFFVSFDPGGFVSIDKPPLGFWIETASAKLFGFSGVSLILPEALAAVLSVAVLYRLVARIWGRGAGLLAADRLVFRAPGAAARDGRGTARHTREDHAAVRAHPARECPRGPAAARRGTMDGLGVTCQPIGPAARGPPTAQGEAQRPRRIARWAIRCAGRTTWPTDGQTNDTQMSRDGLRDG